MFDFQLSSICETDYTNHRGERRLRRFIFLSLWLGVAEHYEEEQWFVYGFDLEKLALRNYALKGFEA